MCVCVCVYVHVCVLYPPLRVLITSGMIWNPYDWLNKFYSFYMVAVVGIISKRGFGIQVHHRNQANKSKLALYKP